MAEKLTDKLQKFNPFARKTQDEEEVGQNVTHQSVAGGGRAARQTAITDQLRVSPALKKFLVDENVLPESDVDLDSDNLSLALKALVTKPHINLPPELTDRSHALSAAHRNPYVIDQEASRAT